MAVIPPGLDFERVQPVDINAPPPEGDDEPPIWREISRFLQNPRKPAILVLARPDAKKNLVRKARSNWRAC
jgi:sucrose-phosphate synthase